MQGARASASRYEVLTKIATGGMATVYVGRLRGAVGFSRLVAIKKPHAFLTSDAELAKQLEREARIASMVHHPNVVSVLDVDEVDGEIALVMDYVEGCTLRDLVDDAEVRKEPIDRIVVRVLLDVAAGLHAAHRATDEAGHPLGVVHRDVSPHNVLIGRDGVARLTDFGIAKVADAERERTATDVLKGKLAYLPPEYVEERRFEVRSDLFALAVVTWEALALERLFRGPSPTETLKRVLLADAPPLTSVRPELGPLSDVIASALRRTPEERPTSVEAFAQELEARARELDLVGTHAEVGQRVDALSGDRTRERREALEASAAHAASGVPKSGRDEIATVSMVAPRASGEPSPARLDPSARSHASAGGPRRAPILAFAAVALVLVGVGAAAAWRLRLTHEAPVESALPLAASADVPAPAPSTTADLAAAPTEPPVPASVVSAAPTAAPRHAPRAPATAEPRGRVHHPPRAASHATAPTLVPSHAPPNPYSQ